MGTGFSAVCSSQRSVVIANSLQVVRRENSVRSVRVDTEPYKTVPSKLHPCISRDSGIVENEIPHGHVGYLRPESETNNDPFIPDDPDDISDSTDSELSDTDERGSFKIDRPHSCRLGNRGNSRKMGNKSSIVAEERLVQYLRSARTECNGDNLSELLADQDGIGQGLKDDDSFFGDSDPDESDIVSLKRETKRNKSAYRSNSCRSTGRANSVHTVSEVGSLSDSDGSDSDFWTIPDETDLPKQKSSGSRNKKGWVGRDEEFDRKSISETSGSITPTPRSSQSVDYYRIVSDSYRRYGANIDKKASERSISSIILMPIDDHMYTNTNMEWYESSNCLPIHLQRRMDDLVEAFLDSLQDRHAQGKLTKLEYERILRNLRHQLVEFVFGCIANDVTPRLEVRASTQSMFSDSSWSVDIQLKPADEEILQTSEKQLAQKLVHKGTTITREDIAVLLGDHLRTIEQLQHVRDSGRLQQTDARDDKHRLTSAPQSRKTSTNMSSKRKKVPSSAPNKSSRTDKRSETGNVIARCHKEPLEREVVLPGRVDKRFINGYISSGEDSDSTIENISDSEPRQHLVKKTKSLDEKRLRDAQMKEALDEIQLSQRVSRKIWTTHMKLTEEELCILISDARESFVKVYGQYIANGNRALDEIQLSQRVSRKIWTTHMKLTEEELCILISDARESFVKVYGQYIANGNRVSISAVPSNRNLPGGRKSKASEKQTPEHNHRDLEQELIQLDQEFVQNIRKNFQSNAISQQELEKDVQEHMRKTSVVRVQAIRVGPAPLSRTRSLNDAVDYSRSESSANSNISRRSEPDMRKYTTVSPDYDDIWGSNDRLSRGNSARRNAPRAMTSRRRSGQTQVHGLSHMEPLSEGTEEHVLPKVEEIEGKFSVKSRPDSGIAVSMSSGSYSSYSSSEVTKETDDIDEACITESSEMRDRIEKVGAESHNDMKSLAAAITKGLTSPHMKAQALYYWLTNLSIAKYSRCNKGKNTPSGKLKQLVEKKTSHAQLYQDLCKAAALKCEKIDGYVKNKDYLPGNTVQSPKFQHTWNAVSIDGQYRLVDPFYGARREKFFLDHHFMTSPDVLVLSHFPKDKKWLLMNQTISIDDFEGHVKTWPAMFHFGIRPLNMKSVIRTYDGKLSITVLLQNVAVIPKLEYAGPGPELDADSLVDYIDEEIKDVDNRETFHVTLPQEGKYYFTLQAHVLEEDKDVPVFQYRIDYTDELL